MTDEQIIKALEYCSKQSLISECERCEVQKGCRPHLISKAIELINRQKAEIERLQNDIKTLRFSLDLCKGWEERAKAEAIKEFVEKLCEDRVSNDPVVIATKCLLKEMVGDNK